MVGGSILTHLQTVDASVENVVRMPIVINLRGISQPKSVDFLRKCQLRAWDLSEMCVRTVREPVKIYDVQVLGNYEHFSFCTSQLTADSFGSRPWLNNVKPVSGLYMLCEVYAQS